MLEVLPVAAVVEVVVEAAVEDLEVIAAGLEAIAVVAAVLVVVLVV